MSSFSLAVKDAMEAGRAAAESARRIVEGTLLWKTWERLLETNFLDRSVALAGKAFVSFFPFVIVVAAFLPHSLRIAVFSTLTRHLGVTGGALTTAKKAFASAGDIRKATGVLGLLLTLFFASSFTTALQRLYIAAWRRPHAGSVGTYVRGIVWVLGIIAYMALLGGIRKIMPGPVGAALFVVVVLVMSSAVWSLTAWMMLLGQVRLRVLIPSGLITGIASGVYTLSATVWMPHNVTSNANQFGVFGIALSLVTWFSGAAICIMIGACAGPILAEDPGMVGRIARFGADSLLVDGAPPSLPPPLRAPVLADALTPADEDGAR